ncbi:protein FAM124A-like [Dreissena polymorpha]|uniref:FAM124 domain-containing protein n=1 Tax=Dreissena polymorpha TaxID=45954 RepID=A0A9D4MVA3_DREPO|nr:protein FAM124A-like [Dreissena polymorpha]KAH3884015.1 hypothetical protein DPMN_007985 [Dreissena polymorpha]
MADGQTGDLIEESGNAYKCRVTLLAPPNKMEALESVIGSLMDWVDPSRQIVDVEEKIPGEHLYKDGIAKRDITGCLVTPAMSIMLFAKETGEMSVSDLQRALLMPPWQFHHKVELQNRNAPNKPVAKQEFFRLANDFPLFAACPVLSNTEHVRINLYVHNYPEMVDFYRTITETEIETSKPEFCIFELYRQPGLDIQLSLKHSPYISPVPVESAYISFNVKSITAIKVATHNSKIVIVGGNVYTTHDPDGNLVILYENNQNTEELYCDDLGNAVNNQTLADTTKCISCFENDDGRSQRSVAGSHDSGQFSDNEGNRARGREIDNNIIKKTISKSAAVVSKREKSEGYASSDSGSSYARVGNRHATYRPRADGSKTVEYSVFNKVAKLRDNWDAVDKMSGTSDCISGATDCRLVDNGTIKRTECHSTNGARKLVRTKDLNTVTIKHSAVYI